MISLKFQSNSFTGYTLIRTMSAARGISASLFVDLEGSVACGCGDAVRRLLEARRDIYHFILTAMSTTPIRSVCALGINANNYYLLANCCYVVTHRCRN